MKSLRIMSLNSLSVMGSIFNSHLRYYRYISLAIRLVSCNWEGFGEGGSTGLGAKDTIAHATAMDLCSKGLRRGWQCVAVSISSSKDICRVGSGSDEVLVDHVLKLLEHDRIDV